MADGPLALVFSVPAGKARVVRSRLLYFKIASMSIGFLIAVNSLAAVMLALALISTNKGTLESAAGAWIDWKSGLDVFTCKGGSSPATSTAPPTQSRAAEVEDVARTTASALGFLVIGTGIPSIIHFIVSAQLIIGAYRERCCLIGMWIRYTQMALTVHLFLHIFVLVTLFAINQYLLGFVLSGVLLTIIIMFLFFLLIVDQYNCMLHNRQVMTILRKKIGEAATA